MQGAAIAPDWWVDKLPLAIGSRISPKRNDPSVVPLHPNVTFLPFLSGSGEKQQAVAQIPLDGIWLGAAGIRSTEYGYIRIRTTKKEDQKSPWLKFLKVLRKPLLTGFALYRGVIRRERPAFHPSFCPPTNFLPFLSGSGEKRQAVAQIPLDEIWLGAAGIRSTEYGYIQNLRKQKARGENPPCLKFLKVLRKLLSRSFLSRVWDRVPRSYSFPRHRLHGE